VLVAPVGPYDWIEQRTDASGSYSYALPPGDYRLYVDGNNADPTIRVPQGHSRYSTSNLFLTQNTVMDIVISAKRVNVHVQDPAGNPVGNVNITTNFPWTYSLTLGTLSAYGRGGYSSPITTDANGDAVLWLFPTDPNGEKYTFTASPPAETNYLTFYVSDVSVLSDMSMLIALQLATPTNQPPVAVGQDVSAAAGSTCTSPASIDNGSYDPDGDPPITLTQSPPGPYLLGTTPVTLTVTDSKGASSQYTGIVTMVDITPPTITTVLVNPAMLWPPNHKMVDVTVNYNAADNCTSSSNITCALSVKSNEPISNSDYAIVDAHHVRLRAERLGSGNGRIYTITVTCTDTSGNSSNQAVTVTVPHDQGKK
jgi:hypothetical protein